MGLYRTVSDIKGDKKLLQNFPTFVAYLTPLFRGFPWNFVAAAEIKKARMIPLPDRRKCDDICIRLDTASTLDVRLTDRWVESQYVILGIKKILY